MTSIFGMLFTIAFASCNGSLGGYPPAPAPTTPNTEVTQNSYGVNIYTTDNYPMYPMSFDVIITSKASQIPGTGNGSDPVYTVSGKAALNPTYLFDGTGNISYGGYLDFNLDGIIENGPWTIYDGMLSGDLASPAWAPYISKGIIGHVSKQLIVVSQTQYEIHQEYQVVLYGLDRPY